MITIFAILTGLFFAFMVSSDEVKHKIDWGVLAIICTIICMTVLIIDAIEVI